MGRTDWAGMGCLGGHRGDRSAGSVWTGGKGPDQLGEGRLAWGDEARGAMQARRDLALIGWIGEELRAWMVGMARPGLQGWP